MRLAVLLVADAGSPEEFARARKLFLLTLTLLILVVIISILTHFQ